jgi:predicted TIM-barrel fold metal-dependent hydrolase
MKIDIFPHIMPRKYIEALEKKLPPAVSQSIRGRCEMFPALTDVARRFLMMDKYEGMVQALTLSVPFVERFTEPKVTVELVKLGNDELAELVAKYPDRFVAAIGNLPMNDLAASLVEVDRIIDKLHFKGIQLCTDINGKPLDAPEFMPLYEKMNSYGLPILLHPTRPPTVPDYATEKTSKYILSTVLGWPYDTSAAMIRLVLAQVLQKYPRTKFITHHCGAMIPYFAKRIENFLRNPGMKGFIKNLDKSLIDYLKEFYADTALSGSTIGLMCGYTFFGADHIVFGTDMPFGSWGEPTGLDEIVQAIEQMDIPDADKEKIFSSNAIKLLKLPV